MDTRHRTKTNKTKYTTQKSIYKEKKSITDPTKKTKVNLGAHERYAFPLSYKTHAMLF